jgi:hypothetical protein
LIETGHADEVLDLGQELVTVGTQQVEASDDEGETAMEVARCMPIIVSALQKSSLDDIEKLNWALDALMEDQYEICEAFAEYLQRSHSQSSWHELADQIIGGVGSIFVGTEGKAQPQTASNGSVRHLKQSADTKGAKVGNSMALDGSRNQEPHG